MRRALSSVPQLLRLRTCGSLARFILMRWALLWLGISQRHQRVSCVWPAVQAPGGRARRPVLLVEAIDAPEVTVAPDLAQGRDVVQSADLGDWAAVSRGTGKSAFSFGAV